MTQIEQIKAEIESLQAKTSIGLNEYDAGYENGKAEVCRLLLNFINSLPVEPVSEDLKSAAEEYAYTNWEDEDYHEGASKGLPFDPIGHTEKTFQAGANWQKEQMMAKAVDGEVGYWNIRGLSVNMELPRKFEEGDKVKLIIIKEV